ncbi:hypothetical protein NDU88_003062 [Pleurodeles waltl]|uniref:Uncharacterized protein n=1 Tax=Pleurodeles waltl TaxID=8319 RepID=A0AAV7SDS2_PLEWA|nr:hypothetical protein NDU88_003062 [Pleurodeles waltl]
MPRRPNPQGSSLYSGSSVALAASGGPAGPLPRCSAGAAPLPGGPAIIKGKGRCARNQVREPSAPDSPCWAPQSKQGGYCTGKGSPASGPSCRCLHPHPGSPQSLPVTGPPPPNTRSPRLHHWLLSSVDNDASESQANPGCPFLNQQSAGSVSPTEAAILNFSPDSAAQDSGFAPRALRGLVVSHSVPEPTRTFSHTLSWDGGPQSIRMGRGERLRAGASWRGFFRHRRQATPPSQNY